MKLEIIKRQDVLDAAEQLFENGIPVENLSNNYWVTTTQNREFPFLALTRKAYEVAGGTDFDAQSTDFYRKYIENLGFEINYYAEGLSLIKDYEVNHFHDIHGRTYSKEIQNDVRNGNVLKPFVRKLNYWAEQSVIEGFQFKSDNSWKWSTKFKNYLWLKITKPSASGLVYIVLGSDRNMLFMELNYQREQVPMNQQAFTDFQMKALDNILQSSHYTPVRITPEDLKSYTWEKLIAQTEEFMYTHEDVYDEMEAIAQSTAISQDLMSTAFIEPFDLVETSPPSDIRSRISEVKTFKGRKIDWNSKNLRSGILGTKGEMLILELEKEKLKDFKVLSENVRKVDDGKGYDILSFTKAGLKLYIEVKTTTGGISEPFYISDNELEFAKANQDEYVIYRLYDFDRKNITSKYFKLTAQELIAADKKSINYEISYSK